MFERTWIEGVAQPLPPGEALHWEGRPDARALARHALHIRVLAGYFALIIVAGLVGAIRDAVPVEQLAFALATQVALALVVLGLVRWYASLLARNAVYAITDRRVVMRVGLLLPTTVNLPFRLLEAADAARFRDGTGQIALRLMPPERVSFLLFWPHVRPWRLRAPEPMLRGLTDFPTVMTVLRQALEEARDTEAAKAAPEMVESPAHSGQREMPRAAVAS